MGRGDWTRELKKGSIQLCVLALLVGERKYGFQLIKELREASGGFFDLAEGTLYPALHRLKKQGLLSAERVLQEDRPARKYYSLTSEGSRALGRAVGDWRTMTAACERVLALAGVAASEGVGRG